MGEEEYYGESDAIGDWEDEASEVDEEGEEGEDEVSGDVDEEGGGSHEAEEEDEGVEWSGFGAAHGDEVDESEPSEVPSPTSPGGYYFRELLPRTDHVP